MGAHRYFIIYKPYKMVSQFISPDKVRLLGDLDFDFPEGTHAIGRLDNNSEGLLILTTNKRVTKLLFESEVPHERTYMVQVQYHVEEPALKQLRDGLAISATDGQDYITHPCKVDISPEPPFLAPRDYKMSTHITYTWLRMTLTEGKFHQVRKMVAAVRHRCIRLIRTSIEDLELADMKPGEVRELDEDTFFEKLKIDKSLYQPSSVAV